MENITIRETPRRKKRMNFGMYQAIKVVVFIVFALYAVSLAFPFFWMLFNSVKPNGEFLSGNIFGLPGDTPAVRPSRSSRTKDSSYQISSACAG